MAWTILWLPDAEKELADVWVASNDRARVTLAADQIDKKLKRNPADAGESRSTGRRILIVPPLVATFRMLVDDRLVQVVNVREFRSR